jgi:hypothetical protein
MFDPVISATIEDASVDSSITQTLVVVGQSNTATAGLYKELEFLTHKQINTKFGENSHIASSLRDVITMYADSIVKPRLWAVSYADVSEDTPRVLESTVVGTATRDLTLKININGLNPDRTSAQTAGVAALRMTKGAYCAAYTVSNEEFGNAYLASDNFTPILAKATYNDVIVEVAVSSGDNATAIATKINAAINAATKSLYSSTSSAGVLTLTCLHKGAIGNFIGFEPVPSSFRDAGFAITTTEDTAGEGVPDASGILNLEDEEGTKLSALNFNLISLPYGYSSTALQNDAFAKFENVLAYGNRCLEYIIFKGTAVDTSSTSAVNAVASANPVEEKGLVKCILLSKLSGLTIKPVTDYAESAYIKTKQLSPIQFDSTLGYNVGATSTLADSTLFNAISNVFASSMARKFIIEKKMIIDFYEKKYSFGTGAPTNKISIISKEKAIGLFEFYYDVLAGLKSDPVYGTDYSGLIDSAEQFRKNFVDVLTLRITYDKTTGQLSTKAVYELMSPIKGILFPQSFR